jgi:hypothetical protein
VWSMLGGLFDPSSGVRVQDPEVEGSTAAAAAHSSLSNTHCDDVDIVAIYTLEALRIPIAILLFTCECEALM